MKYLFLIIGLIANNVMARDVYVQPHVTKNGTFVQGHHRTAPDTTNLNNYSTQGNVNPYTGEAGHIQRDPYPNYQQPAHNQNKHCAPGYNCY